MLSEAVSTLASGHPGPACVSSGGGEKAAF